MSYTKWKERLSPSFEQSEKRYYDHTLMITGAIDALIRFPGDPSAILVDFKTSAQEAPITWPMQAHLYAHLLGINGHVISPRYIFIKLDKNGYMPSVFEYHFDANIRAKCLMAVEEFWERFQDENNSLP